MDISVTGQTMEFLYSALLGIALGIVYDIFRLVRTYLKAGKHLTGVFDVVYWLFALLATIAFIMTVSWGRLRWYVLIGEFCGGFVYMCTISRLIFRLLDIIIKLVIRFLRILSAPVYFISSKSMKLARGTRRRIKDSGNKRRLKRQKDKSNQDEEGGSPQWQ